MGFEDLFSGFKKKKQEEINPLRNEHLAEGVPPLRASIVGYYPDDITYEALAKIEKEGEYVDFYADEELILKHSMLNSGAQTYAVSDCNEKDKYSNQYSGCTGVVMVGTDKTTKKQISFLSHQDPAKFLSNYKEVFTKDLGQGIERFLAQTDPQTVDVVVFGGENLSGEDEYRKSIRLLDEICKSKLGFSPAVLTGPNAKPHIGPASMYVDTQNRRLYLLRPGQVEMGTNQSFLPSQIKKESEKWKEDPTIRDTYK